MRKILNVCITYYTSDLERKRSVYERAIDPVLFSTTIMAFVEKKGESRQFFARIPAIYAKFYDFRRYKIYGFYGNTAFKNVFAWDTRKYDNHAINLLSLSL